MVSENKYAAGRIKRPRGPRLRRATAPTTVTQDLHSKALKNYLDNHIAPSTSLDIDITGSLSACILAWQKTGHSSRLVELALLSMALAVYAKKHSHPRAATESFSIYHELLKLTQEQIARPTLDVASIDACLLTIFLMGRCESVMHNTLVPDENNTLAELKSWSHHDGAMALLRLWHMHFRERDISMIVKQTRRGMLKSLLLRRMSVPDWLCEGHEFGEQGFELGYDSILVHLVDIRSEINLGKSMDENASRIGLHDRLTTIAVDLIDLRQELPESFSYCEHEIAESDHLWFPNPKLRIYRTPAHAIFWAHILATRLVMVFTNMSMLLYWPESRREREVNTTLLRQLASYLAAVIPQAIGLVEQNGSQIKIHDLADLKPWQASSVVWPLSMAASIRGYDEKLLEAFRSQLTKIGEIVGDGVLQSVSTEAWPLLLVEHGHTGWFAKGTNDIPSADRL